MPEFIQQIITNAGMLVGVLILWKSGLLKWLMNGKFWNGGKTPDNHLESISERLEILETNHLHEIKDGQKEILSRLDEIIKYGVKIRE